jgi:hypothetical protein
VLVHSSIPQNTHSSTAAARSARHCPRAPLRSLLSHCHSLFLCISPLRNGSCRHTHKVVVTTHPVVSRGRGRGRDKGRDKGKDTGMGRDMGMGMGVGVDRRKDTAWGMGMDGTGRLTAPADTTGTTAGPTSNTTHDPRARAKAKDTDREGGRARGMDRGMDRGRPGRLTSGTAAGTGALASSTSDKNQTSRDPRRFRCTASLSGCLAVWLG